jgi:transposase
VCHRIAAGVPRRAGRPGWVAAQRPGALERAGLLLSDRAHAAAAQTEVETRMIAVLDQLGVTDLVSSIPGLSALSGAKILAETGDMARFATARSVVKHAGLNPAEHTSATLRGRAGSANAAGPPCATPPGPHWATTRYCRPIHPPHHPRARPARPRASPGRVRRGLAALAARHHHQRRPQGTRPPPPAPAPPAEHDHLSPPNRSPGVPAQKGHQPETTNFCPREQGQARTTR